MYRWMLVLTVFALGCEDFGKSIDSGDTAASSSGGGDGGGGTSGDPWADEYVQAHNNVRDTVGVAHLSWSDELAASSLVWADALVADNCAFEHDLDNPYGENLYWSSWDATPTEVTDGWSSEVAFYDYGDNSCEPGQMCGHYTQVVWDDTTHVGCAKSACTDGSVVQVCRYDPPGNWVGEKPY